MALSIKNQEAEALVQRLAGLTGESLTEAIKNSVRARLTELERVRDREGMAARLTEIGRRCGAENRSSPGAPARSEDHAKVLYDDLGLPR